VVGDRDLGVVADALELAPGTDGSVERPNRSRLTIAAPEIVQWQENGSRSGRGVDEHHNMVASDDFVDLLAPGHHRYASPLA